MALGLGRVLLRRLAEAILDAAEDATDSTPSTTPSSMEAIALPVFLFFLDRRLGDGVRVERSDEFEDDVDTAAIISVASLRRNLAVSFLADSVMESRMLFTLLYSCDTEHGFSVAPSDSDGVISLVITS